jgi:hypothetical protein
VKSLRWYRKVAGYIGNVKIVANFKMKHLLLILFAILIYSAFNANTHDDGWYSSQVLYKNFRTGYEATYTLRVEVKSDRVINIFFPKGGSVHSGSNNSGYSYSGGELELISGSLYRATVNVVFSDGSPVMYNIFPLLFLSES